MHFIEIIRSAFRRLLPGKKKYRGDFVRRPRYSLQVVNLSSLSTLFSFSARRWHFFAMLAGAFLLAGMVWLLVFIYTPLSRLLPTKLSSSLRDEYVQMSIRLDSITVQAQANERYAANILAVLGDSLPKAPTAPPSTDIADIPLDSLMSASERERRFVEQFESEERFNISVLSPIAGEGMVFYPPVGASSGEVRPGTGSIPSVSIAPARATAVSAVYRGTVISTFYSASRGVTVVIQHPNEFITEYSGLSDLFVARGDKVAAGERIGMAQPGHYPLTLELWRKGSPLDPTQYIPFAKSSY